MKNFITFVGDDRNEGRFGLVPKGRVLVMTDREAAFVKGDKDFRRATPKEITDTEENVTPEEREAAARQVRVEELRQMNISELREFADNLSQINPGFNFPSTIGHQDLLKLVLQHERSNATNQGDEPIEEEDEQETPE